MLKIAVVENEKSDSDILINYVKRYGKERGVAFDAVCFSDAVSFLDGYRPVYDIVFMDIDMPYLNGMNAAIKLRETDAETALIFVTNLQQYAVKGYEVRALDYILKPIGYYDFSMKIDAAVKRVSMRTDNEKIVINLGRGMLRLAVKDLAYIEVYGHKLIYHTTEKNYEGAGPLKTIEGERALKNFIKCNSCYLVNPDYVEKVDGYTAYVCGDALAISHPRRAEFLKALNCYLGGR